jgi:hypothetical protein
MRWENLSVESGGNLPRDAALFGADAVTTRKFDTPDLVESRSTRSGPSRS